MRRLILPLVVLLAGGGGSAAFGAKRATEAPPAFAGGAPSVDALVHRLLRALAAGDREKLRRLRVSEAEYRDVILPANVEGGAPRRRVPAAKGALFWSLLDTKSRYSELGLLAEHGGQRYRLRGVRFLRGTRRYAGFTAHQRLLLTLEDDAGRTTELRTGSIAELDGVYKFVSFIRD